MQSLAMESLACLVRVNVHVCWQPVRVARLNLSLELSNNNLAQPRSSCLPQPHLTVWNV